MILELHVLAAGHGDSLVVSYGDDDTALRHVLIDGGPAGSYENGLRRFLDEHPEIRRFELMVLTHVDADHVDGLLCLMNDLERFPDLRIREAWMNGYRQLSAEVPERGALQGTYLEHLLGRRSIPTNTIFDGKTVYRDLGNAVELPGGARLVVVTPRRHELQRMAKEWRTTCEEAGFEPDDVKEIAKRLDERRTYDPTRERGDGVARTKRPGSDSSPANGSSIGIMFEFGGRRMFLAGDAHARTMLESLTLYRQQLNHERLPLALFKLPHHGSVANLRPDVLEQIDCDCYVISTNGQYFGHPDLETLKMIADDDAARTRPPSTVAFNFPERISPEMAALDLRFERGDAGYLRIDVAAS